MSSLYLKESLNNQTLGIWQSSVIPWKLRIFWNFQGTFPYLEQPVANPTLSPVPRELWFIICPLEPRTTTTVATVKRDKFHLLSYRTDSSPLEFTDGGMSPARNSCYLSMKYVKWANILLVLCRCLSIEANLSMYVLLGSTINVRDWGTSSNTFKSNCSSVYFRKLLHPLCPRHQSKETLRKKENKLWFLRNTIHSP